MFIPPPHQWDGATAQRLLPTFRARLHDVQMERQRRHGVTDEPDHDLELLESRCKDAIELLEKVAVASLNWLLANRIVTAIKQLFEAPPRRALIEGSDDEL